MEKKGKPVTAAQKTKLAALEKTLRSAALAYPETTEDFPWGERAIKVKGKAFLFMRLGDAGLSLSVKLPHSRDIAADLPFCEPTHYGLGKHGWITASIVKPDKSLQSMLLAWLDESFRTVAPKKLVATLVD